MNIQFKTIGKKEIAKLRIEELAINLMVTKLGTFFKVNIYNDVPVALEEEIVSSLDELQNLINTIKKDCDQEDLTEYLENLKSFKEMSFQSV